MTRLAIRVLIFLGSAAIGLLVAALLIDDVSVTAGGFILVVVLFAVIQSVVSPLLTQVTERKAHALLGGVGLLSTLVALLVATLVSDALTISGGVTTWIATTVVVWLVTALATLLLPLLFRKVGQGAGKNDAPAKR